MDNVFTRSLDRFLGRGDASIAIPPMDGALKPNGAIDEAEHLLSRNRPDNLIVTSNGVLFSSDRELLRAGADWSSVTSDCSNAKARSSPPRRPPTAPSRFSIRRAACRC